jgi:predicted PurR-regulated permease PerM
MQTVRRVLAVALALWLVAPQVNAQVTTTTQPATQAAIDQALAARATAADADRQVIRRVLDRTDVRDVAARMGVDIQRLQSSVSVLGPDELAQVAAQARTVDQNLAGGATTIVLTTTTIIIVLLLVILIIVAVD